MAKKINFGSTVSLKQAAQLIASCPENRFMVRGEPGIGKSSMLPIIAAMIGRITGKEYHISYCDVGTMDLGDTAMPAMDHENKVTRYYPSSRFGLHTGKPVCIMLDEFTKGADPIKNMLHPLLESKNPRIGDVPLPEGSIVFLTGNLDTDGVGDMLKAHSRNRITEIVVRKPNAEEWIEWAVENELEAPVIAWVKQFPHALASYMDESQKENPYIYNPSRVQKAVVTPRSLELASRILKNREINDTESTVAALCGTIGEAAARDMQAFVEYQDELPSWETIINNPEKTKIPTSPGACAVLIYGAITKVEQKSMAPFMKYLARFDTEWQAVFILNLAKSSTKQAMAFGNQQFADWVQRNEGLL